MKAAIALAALLVTATSAFAAPPEYKNLPPDLAAAARAFDQAQIKGDAAALNNALAGDYMLVSGSGKHFNKQQFIADLTSPGGAQPDFTLEDPVQKVWSDGAVLGGLVNETVMQDGKPVAIALRFADVWARRHGKWQVIFTQAFHLAK